MAQPTSDAEGPPAVPEWARTPFRQFLAFTTDENDLVRLAAAGISQLTKNAELVAAVNKLEEIRGTTSKKERQPRRGEPLALRWRDVEMLERRLHVRESYVRGQFVSPKSRASRRTLAIGPRTTSVFDEQYKASRYRSDDSLVFCHPILGTPLDPSKLSRDFMRPALSRRRSPSRSARGTTYATRRLRTKPQRAIRPSMCSSKRGTRKARSLSAISTRRR